MPTNLPPEAIEAERLYREAQTPEERLTRLETFISLIPKHKGTDKLRADLRKKLSKLKEAEHAARGAAARSHSPYRIRREGAGQVAVIGAPNTGKSALVRCLTHAEPEVAPHPFTTWEPTVGMLEIDYVGVQLIDTPPLHAQHVEPELLDLLRRVDLLLIVVDLQADPLQQLEDVEALLTAHGIVPAHRPTADNPHSIAKPILVAANKCDDVRRAADCAVLRELLTADWHVVPFSAVIRDHDATLKQAVYAALGIMRIYSKPPGQEPDRTTPFVLPRGATVEQFAAQVHNDFVKHLHSARVWGVGVFDGQQVGRDHVLHDGDVVELRSQ